MKIEKRVKVTGGIPTASLPDIVFMLLIFFMVSTVFKESRGLQVSLPAAKKIEKLPGKRGTAYIWADRANRISIDDKIITDISSIRHIMYQKVVDELHPLKVVSLRIDKEVDMETVTKVQEELRECGGAALNVNYSAKTAAD